MYRASIRVDSEGIKQSLEIDDDRFKSDPEFWVTTNVDHKAEEESTAYFWNRVVWALRLVMPCGSQEERDCITYILKYRIALGCMPLSPYLEERLDLDFRTVQYCLNWTTYAVNLCHSRARDNLEEDIGDLWKTDGLLTFSQVAEDCMELQTHWTTHR